MNTLRATGANVAIVVDDNFGSNQLLADILPNVRTINIRVRMDGQYYWFEGDYLKHVLNHVHFRQIDNDGIKASLNDHKEVTPNNTTRGGGYDN